MTEPNEPISLEAVRSEPIPDLVECLERLLERAKSGDLRSIVYMAYDSTGSESGNSGDRYDRFAVMGQVFGMGLDYYLRRREEDQGKR